MFIHWMPTGDAQTGMGLWTAHPEDNFTARITAAPTYHDGRLYVPFSCFEEFSAATVTYECCKSEGAVAALDANTGKMLWKTYVVPELPKPLYKNSRGVQQWGPAGGAVWNSPTVDPVRPAVYLGTGDADRRGPPSMGVAICGRSVRAGITSGCVPVLLGGMWIANLSYWGFNQYIIQRAFAAKNLRVAPSLSMQSGMCVCVMAPSDSHSL